MYDGWPSLPLKFSLLRWMKYVYYNIIPVKIEDKRFKKRITQKIQKNLRLWRALLGIEIFGLHNQSVSWTFFCSRCRWINHPFENIALADYRPINQQKGNHLISRVWVIRLSVSRKIIHWHILIEVKRNHWCAHRKW